MVEVLDGNANEQGQKYSSLAIKGRNDHNALPNAAYEQFCAIEKRLTQLWVESTDQERKRIVRYVGVISRFSSLLLQIRRVADGVKRLTEGLLVPNHALSQGVGASQALSADELCTDFESLLFHGRAVLDKLTHTIIGAEYGGTGFRFSRLKNELSNHQNDKRAKRVSALIDRASQLTGTLIDVGAETALRSKVAHYGSITENPRHCFSLHGIEGKRVLVFDCESLGYPVVTTAHRLSQAVPYIVGNSLAIYLGCKQMLTRPIGLTRWSFTRSISQRRQTRASFQSSA